jgi:hypothetical protein
MEASLCLPNTVAITFFPVMARRCIAMERYSMRTNMPNNAFETDAIQHYRAVHAASRALLEKALGL